MENIWLAKSRTTRTHNSFKIYLHEMASKVFLGDTDCRQGYCGLISHPSIRDFVEDFLSNSGSAVADLVSGAHFFEQYATLWTGRHGHRYSGIDLRREEFLRQLQGNIFGPSASTIREVNGVGETIGLNHRHVSNESRAEFAVRVANDLKNESGDRFLNVVIDALEKLWDQGCADREDLVRLLRALTDRGLRREDKAVVAAKQCLSAKIEEIGEFRAIAHFAEMYSDQVSSSDLDRLKNKFPKFASEYSDGWDDDPDWFRQIAADLEFVGERLGVDVTGFTDRLYARADEVENERGGMEPDGDDEDGWESSSSHRDDVHQMFQGLREELES